MDTEASLNLPALETVPVIITSDGAVRVGGTRVTLRTVIYAFNQGATAEAIVDRYPALDLGDVYLVIGYYLRHRADVDAYMREYEAVGERMRAENQARFDQTGLRERLLKRLADRQ